jgi:hypothetical protein
MTEREELIKLLKAKAQELGRQKSVAVEQIRKHEERIRELNTEQEEVNLWIRDLTLGVQDD